MGGGAWTTTASTNYVAAKYADYDVKDFNDVSKLLVNQIYDSVQLVPELNPKNVIRECRDSSEHPNTFPIILALDVTGSMGEAARNCAAKLNDIMTNLYDKVEDVEFLMMGIGDLSYDHAPIQATQFESDVRILDQTTKIYFEAGGGGNSFESYTAAWFFGLHHTDLDCWKRGKKGIIITMGDEPLNPYLPCKSLREMLGNKGQIDKDIDTEDLYRKVLKKFDVYHIAITDNEGSYAFYAREIDKTWGELLGQRCLKAKSSELPKVIGQIVDDSMKGSGIRVSTVNGGISW